MIFKSKKPAFECNGASYIQLSLVRVEEDGDWVLAVLDNGYPAPQAVHLVYRKREGE